MTAGVSIFFLVQTLGDHLYLIWRMAIVIARKNEDEENG